MAKKILIIDDDPVVVKYLENLFQDNGYETYTASDGHHGATILAEVRPDLITLDLQMPEQWGPRFYRRLAKDKALKDIPVIVISGLTGSQYSIPKAVGHLGKPFTNQIVFGLVAHGDEQIAQHGRAIHDTWHLKTSVTKSLMSWCGHTCSRVQRTSWRLGRLGFLHEQDHRKRRTQSAQYCTLLHLTPLRCLRSR